MRRLIPILSLVLAAAAIPAWGQLDILAPDAEAPGQGPVTPSAMWLAEGAKPKSKVILLVTFDIAPPYHIQSSTPAEDWIIPTTIALVDPPAGLSISRIKWPETKDITVDFGNGPQKLPFFVGEAQAFVFVHVGKGVAVGPHPLQLKVGWQACDDTTCMAPEERTLDLTLNVVDPAASIGATGGFDPNSIPDAGGESLDLKFFGASFHIDPRITLLLLLFAALGGLLLNFTPCVLPMVPIKVMGLSRAAAGSRGRALWLGIAMSVGVVAFWLMIGAAIAFLSGFDSISELFQRTWFTIGVGVIIAVMGVGMMGVFAAALPQWVYRINPSQETTGGSLGFGVMTAVLATPCTAPFMGSAAAWATTQPPGVTLITFGAIGAGMALPYLVLAAFPKLLHRVPRTGPASELIKQVMGLLMLAAAAYFIGTGVVGWRSEPPAPPSKAYWWVVGLGVVAAGGWLFLRTVMIARSPGNRAIFAGLGLALLITGAGIGYGMTRTSPIDWVYYTPERLAEAKQRRDVIVLDFTAEWCLNCHALERGVLNQPPVVKRLNAPGVSAIKVDITKYEPAQELLADYGSRTIPLLIVLDPAGNEVFRSDAYTVREVMDAIDEAQPG